jgi:hypothetical protein
MYVKLHGAHLLGLEGQIIELEVDISFGLPHCFRKKYMYTVK